MSIWALSDLHLSISSPDKNMEAFGEKWHGYMDAIKRNWKKRVQESDLVLIPGDICWAKNTEEALVDLAWIDQLPGQKLLLKGNHDFWWPSKKKLSSCLPKSLHFIQNDAFQFGDVAIGGARLWDTEEYNFDHYIDFKGPLIEKTDHKVSEKIFKRDVERLKMSLSSMKKEAQTRIAMTHFPPISGDLQDSTVSKILEEFHIDICVFGHLHSLKEKLSLFGEKNGIRYILVAADYVDFSPIKLI